MGNLNIDVSNVERVSASTRYTNMDVEYAIRILYVNMAILSMDVVSVRGKDAFTIRNVAFAFSVRAVQYVFMKDGGHHVRYVRH